MIVLRLILMTKSVSTSGDAAALIGRSSARASHVARVNVLVEALLCPHLLAIEAVPKTGVACSAAGRPHVR